MVDAGRVVRRGLIVALVALLVGAGAVIAATQIDGDEQGGGGEPPAAGSRTDRWAPLAPSPLARTEVAAARVGNFIYVVGGFEERSGETTNAMTRYDIRNNSWTQVRSMPIGVNHAAAAEYKGDLYVLGGYKGRRSLDDEVSNLYRYDPEQDRWTKLKSAPTRRGALTIGVLGDRLYAAGGATNNGTPLKLLEIYDFKTGKWSRGPDMRTRPREHLAGTVAGGFFYVLAGRAGGQGNFTVAERFNPKSKTWERLPDMKKSRGGIAAATVSGDRVVVFGGEESAGTIAEVELYNPGKRRWKFLPGLRTPRHGLGGAAMGDRVYAIEGGTSPGFSFSNAIEAIDVR
jgi:hypothetical protein